MLRELERLVSYRESEIQELFPKDNINIRLIIEYEHEIWEVNFDIMKNEDYCLASRSYKMIRGKNEADFSLKINRGLGEAIERIKEQGE